MAKLIPPLIYSETPSPGEREIFERLKQDPVTANWTVLHSLDIAHPLKHIAGEIDFLIIVPSKGILGLEVKAHRQIRRTEGLWYFGNNHTGHCLYQFYEPEYRPF